MVNCTFSPYHNRQLLFIKIEMIIKQSQPFNQGFMQLGGLITELIFKSFCYKTLQMIVNPYEQLYRKEVKNISAYIPMKEAECMATQISLMYNAFGSAMKDMIGLLSIMYSLQKNDLQKQNKSKEKSSQSLKLVDESQQRQSLKIQALINRQKQVQSLTGKQHDFNKYLYAAQNKPIKTLYTKQPSVSNSSRIQKQPQSKIDNQKKATNFDRIEVVRNKKERQVLNGYSCTMCQRFYRALGEDYIDSNGSNKLCNDCSRHRSNLPPTNFYTDFTQEFGFDD